MKKLLLALLLTGCASGLTEAKVDGLQVYMKHQSYMDDINERSSHWSWRDTIVWRKIINRITQASSELRTSLASSIDRDMAHKIEELNMIMSLVDEKHLIAFDRVYNLEVMAVEKAKKKVEKYGLSNNPEWKESYEKFYLVLDKFNKVIATNDVIAIRNVVNELIAAEKGMKNVYFQLDNKE